MDFNLTIRLFVLDTERALFPTVAPVYQATQIPNVTVTAALIWPTVTDMARVLVRTVVHGRLSIEMADFF